jgi:hypothetical protein
MVMLVELQATCSALGYQEGKKYVKEPDCLGNFCKERNADKMQSSMCACADIV